MIWIVGIASFLVALLATPLVAQSARTLGIVDNPGSKSRKIHKTSIPLMGGIAVFVAIAAMTIVALCGSEVLVSGEVTAVHYGSLLVAALILIVGGVIDDKYELKPRYQILFPILAAIVAIAGGIGIEKMTNPFGSVLMLESSSWMLFSMGWHEVVFSWPGDVFVFLWLMGMMYTTKLLDGLDGLATGIGSIGALVVLLLASTAAYFQPDVAVFSSIVLGAFLGFLVWNLHPAKVFLGEGGALLIGFVLGSLAVLSGGKIATLLLVMGVPILDVAWVITRRLRSKSKVSKGDRQHLHHRLYDLGLNQRQVVFVYVFIAACFGVLTLFLSSLLKVLALLILVLLMLVGGYFLLIFDTKK